MLPLSCENSYHQKKKKKKKEEEEEANVARRWRKGNAHALLMKM